MFAAIDTVIALLVFGVIAIISNWLKSRAGKDRSGDQPPPEQGGGWEEELRRMISGEEAPPRPEPPPRREAPPPPVVRLPPLPAPPPLPRTTARPAAPRASSDLDRGLAVNLPSVKHSPGSHACASDMEKRVEATLRQRGSLAEAATAFLHGRQIESRVAEHMRRVTEETPAFLLRSDLRGVPRAEVVQAREMLRHAATARAAILTSVILGPPKAFKEHA
jgi:hypothetical protein